MAVKRLPIFVLLLAGGCNSAPPASTPTATSIYNSLVEAGCLAPAEGGAAAIAQEEASDSGFPWLGCLFDGGSISGCNVPCSAGD